MSKNKFILSFLAITFVAFASLKAETPEPEILKNLVKQLEKNDEIADNYDFHQESEVKELDDAGKIKKVKKKTYRTILIQDHRYFELVKVDDRDLNESEKKEEAKRRNKFMKDIQKKGKPAGEDDDDDLTWADLMEKYDFKQLPAEGDAAYVITFKPRLGELKERNRTEKILNHLAGKIWVSSDYNLMRADARLATPVKYGLGILANVQELELKYVQTKFDGIWMPETYSLHYKVRVLVKNQIRQVQARYYNLTKRPASSPSAAVNK